MISLSRVLTVTEVVLAGLEKGEGLPFEVVEVEGKGRGVVCRCDIPSNTYLCEYKTACTYHPWLLPKYEQEYSLNEEGSYTLTSPSAPRLVFDATRRPMQVYNGTTLNFGAALPFPA